MIKYLFNNNELKTLFNMCGCSDFKYELINMGEISQSDYDSCVKKLREKKIIEITNNQVVIDKIFGELIKAFYDSDYFIIYRDNVTGISDIVINIERDGRNNSIYKLEPFENLKEYSEYNDFKEDKNALLKYGGFFKAKNKDDLYMDEEKNIKEIIDLLI